MCSSDLHWSQPLFPERDSKKAVSDQEKAAETNAANAAQANTQTTAQDQKVVEQSQAAVEIEAAIAQAELNASEVLQQAVEALSQDAQQVEAQVETPVFDLNQQNVEADPSQTDVDLVDMQVNLESNAQASLQQLDDQEAGSKAAADMELTETKTDTKAQQPKAELRETQDDNVVENSQQTFDTDAFAVQGQSTRVTSFDQFQSIEKQSSDVKASMATEQISTQLKASIDSGKDVIKIQLQPENLGKVDVRIVRGNDGMQLYFTSDTPSTTRMLQASLNQLHQSLMEAGVKVGNMSVSYQGNQGQQQNNGQFQQRKGSFSVYGQESSDLNVDFQTRKSQSALDTIV